MRTFETGATRDTDKDKLDYEGFLAPSVLDAYARYMHRNRIQADGRQRASDNWQKGIPQDAYMKSLWRHFMDVWREHRAADPNRDVQEEALCAMLFNVMGYLFEIQRAASVSTGSDASMRPATAGTRRILSDASITGCPIEKTIPPVNGSSRA